MRVLVPLAILKGETVSAGVVDSLSNAEVVLLGYHVVPEQTPPGQARMSFEEHAEDALGETAAAFEDAGVPVETVLVFTHDRGETVGRVADERGCKAVLSNQRGLVQTFVELDPPEPQGGGGEQPSTTENTHYSTGVDPASGDEPEDVERIFPVVRSGWQLLVVVAGYGTLAARLWEDRAGGDGA